MLSFVYLSLHLLPTCRVLISLLVRRLSSDGLINARTGAETYTATFAVATGARISRYLVSTVRYRVTE